MIKGYNTICRINKVLLIAILLSTSLGASVYQVEWEKESMSWEEIFERQAMELKELTKKKKVEDKKEEVVKSEVEQSEEKPPLKQPRTRSR